jgi:hypothetical protein
MCFSFLDDEIHRKLTHQNQLFVANDLLFLCRCWANHPRIGLTPDRFNIGSTGMIESRSFTMFISELSLKIMENLG